MTKRNSAAPGSHGRSGRLGLALCAALLSACGSRGLPPEERAALEQAVALQQQGRFEEAMSIYRGLLRQSASREIQARAELGLARVQHGIEWRDLKLKELRELGEQGGERTLESIQHRVQIILDEFAETGFADEGHAAAAAALARAREKLHLSREIQAGAVQELIERGQFTGALDYLCGLESKRALSDRRDIADLLVRVRLRSEEDATRVLAEFRARREQDPEAAVLYLDAEMGRFRGTRPYATLLEARLQAGPRPPPAKKEEGGKAEKDDQE